MFDLTGALEDRFALGTHGRDYLQRFGLLLRQQIVVGGLETRLVLNGEGLVAEGHVAIDLRTLDGRSVAAVAQAQKKSAAIKRSAALRREFFNWLG